MAKITDEEKTFISELYLKQAKSTPEIIPLFEAKFGYSPSTRIVNKWKYFNEPDDDDDKKEAEKEGKKVDLGVETEDSRHVKDETIDISKDDIPDEQFNTLCRTFGLSQAQLWDTIVRAKNRGYTKVNSVSGEFSK